MFNRDAKDRRTTDEKLAAMARDPGATEGERTNATHLLFRRRQKREAERPSPFTARVDTPAQQSAWDRAMGKARRDDSMGSVDPHPYSPNCYLRNGACSGNHTKPVG